MVSRPRGSANTLIGPGTAARVAPRVFGERQVSTDSEVALSTRLSRSFTLAIMIHAQLQSEHFMAKPTSNLQPPTSSIQPLASSL